MLSRTRGRTVALAVTAALVASACGTGPNSPAEDTTLDVWLMQHSLSEELVEDFVRDYENRNPGVRVEVTVHEWGGIGDKVTAALAADKAPDVIEVGNTQVAQYVASGGVENLTLKVADLGGDDWIPGLEEPGKIDGYQFGIPYYAANRVVIYRKDLFERAGITKPPATREEWFRASEQLNQPGQQGIYLPGQNWYVLSGFVWDEGGDLAVEQSGQWRGALDTPEAMRGMELYRELQSYGDGPTDSDEAKPDQNEVFAEQEVAQLIAVPGHAKLIEEANPALAGRLGYFPIPGEKSGKPGAVFTGGSVLIQPERSAHPEEGYAFIKLLTGDKWQRQIASSMSYVPNKTTLTDALDGDPGATAMAKGAKNGFATPNSPSWAALEAANPIKDYQTAVLTGQDPEAAARRASDAVTTLLSGSP
ncbi:extracellular solute-binding protein [Streptomyces sp. 549]|uniref:extracellular solute-binding protein n=1 Tax=Streptomyces sp. 549 TaxID=3049076 RepID=UPI0024C258F3|nr:extracellular solute-binding protein [Streptomyces sp. 549]MDK1476815.1 extracellular solute-binding protein [Streptomyces sp. 549]